MNRFATGLRSIVSLLAFPPFRPRCLQMFIEFRKMVEIWRQEGGKTLCASFTVYNGMEVVGR